MLFYFLLSMLAAQAPVEAVDGHADGNPFVDFFISLGLTLLVAGIASYLLVIISNTSKKEQNSFYSSPSCYSYIPSEKKCTSHRLSLF